MVGSQIIVDSCGISEPQMAVTGLNSPADWFVDWVNGQKTSEAGVTVNETTLLTHGPVWQALNILGGDIGLIPFNVRQRKAADTYETASSHNLQSVLTKKTNAYQTPSVWKEWAVVTSWIWGNSLSFIQRNGGGQIVGLTPLPPQWCGYDVDESGEPYYYLQHPKQGYLTYELSEIVHFKGLTSDGFWGYRLAEVAAGVVGHGLALRKHGNATFKNSSRPSGVLEHPGKLPEQARREMRKDWERVHSGAENAGKIAILWEGMKLNPYTISNHDAQWLEAMRLDREQCAGLFNLPPHKLGALENAAVRANLEEQNREYYNTSLARHVNKMREEMNDKLLNRPDLDIKPDPTELLKGDWATQVQTESLSVSSMLTTRNESRIRLGLNPVPGGDEFTNPNTTAGDSGSQDDEEEGNSEEIATAAKALLERQVKQLCTAEYHRLTNKAKSRKNFDGYIDEFYGQDFTALASEMLRPAYDLASKCAPLVDFEKAIGVYATQSKSRAMIFAKSSLEPKKRSEKLQSEWPVANRAATLTSSLLGV